MRLLDRVLGRGRVDRTYDGLRTMMLSVGPEKVVAAANLDRMATAEGPGAPVSGAVRYWALTRAGLRTVGHSSDGPPADAPELQELGGGAFQDYVTAFRPVDEAERATGR